MGNIVDAFAELREAAKGHYDDIDAAQYVEYCRSDGDSDPPSWVCCGQELEYFYWRCPQCKKPKQETPEPRQT